MMIRLKRYGFADAELIKYPAGETWDAVQGSIWEVKPGLRKIASIEDNIVQLASGSADTDLTADLVWVGRGTPAEIEAAKVEGKIVVTEGSMGQVYNLACNQKGALGIVAHPVSAALRRPLPDARWASIGRRRHARRLRGGDAAGRSTPRPRPSRPSSASSFPSAKARS